jgi:hypothetical protein
VPYTQLETGGEMACGLQHQRHPQYVSSASESARPLLKSQETSLKTSN